MIDWIFSWLFFMVIVYIFITFLFFSGIFFYLINFALIPYTSENMLNVRNFVIVSVAFVCVICTLFAFFHLIIDKLFFRKFYEKPKLIPALRRGLLFGLFLVSIPWLKVFGFLFWYTALLCIVLGVLIELLFISISRNIAYIRSANQKKEGLKIHEN
jgi:hypothetical protein